MIHNNWIKNWRYTILNSDPYLVKKMKNIRFTYKIYKNIVKTISVVFIISSWFIYFGIEDIVKDFMIYKILLFFLNLVTFIGIIFPITVSKTLTKKDIDDAIIDNKKKDDELNYIKRKSTF